MLPQRLQWIEDALAVYPSDNAIRSNKDLSLDKWPNKLVKNSKIVTSNVLPDYLGELSKAPGAHKYITPRAPGNYSYVMSKRDRARLDHNIVRRDIFVTNYEMGTQRFGKEYDEGSSTRRDVYADISSIYHDIVREIISKNPGIVLEYSLEPYDKRRNYNRVNVIFPMPDRIERDTIIGMIGIYSGLPGLQYVIKPLFIENYEYQSAYPESPLYIPHLNYTRVKINGIEFLSSDLRLLYNTFIFDTLISTGESELWLPNVTRQDLKLLRELFTGMSPMLYVYSSLSEYTYQLLSPERSLFDLYEEPVVRIAIDRTYSPGLSLREQLNLLKESVVNKVSRVRELVEVASG